MIETCGYFQIQLTIRDVMRERNETCLSGERNATKATHVENLMEKKVLFKPMFSLNLTKGN